MVLVWWVVVVVVVAIAVAIARAPFPCHACEQDVSWFNADGTPHVLPSPLNRSLQSVTCEDYKERVLQEGLSQRFAGRGHLLLPALYANDRKTPKRNIDTVPNHNVSQTIKASSSYIE